MDAEEFYRGLLRAVLNFDKEALGVLVAAGADINYAPINEGPILHIILEYFSRTNKPAPMLEIFQEVINLGADVNRRDPFIETPIAMACQLGYVEAVEILLKSGARFKRSDNAVTHPGCHVLPFSLDIGSNANALKIIKLLAEYGTDVDMHRHGPNGETMLEIAARLRCEKAIELLLQCGADPNRHSVDERKTPLHFATHYDSIKIIKAFLKHGADINLMDTREQTALHWAAGIGHPQVVCALVEGGADLLGKDRFARTPLDEAVYHSRGHTAKYMTEHYSETYKNLLHQWPTSDDFDIRRDYIFRRGMQTFFRNNV